MDRNQRASFTAFSHNLGPKRFGGNKFNILRKTAASQVERLVTDANTLPKGEYVNESNAHWRTGTASGYSEGQSMHFHKGYQGKFTGSAGCQTFPFEGDGTFEQFMGKLEPLQSSDRFQYVLKDM